MLQGSLYTYDDKDFDFTKCEKTKLDQDSFYQGQYEGDRFVAPRKRQGCGKAHYANGTDFDGHWQDNMREGRGRQTLESKNGSYAFVGMYKEDKKHGFGIELHPDGVRYEGHFCKDKRHGSGKIYWPTK